MTSVGAYDAKTHLAQLLERVAQGERITITRHGVPVAVLSPVDRARRDEASPIVDAFKEFRLGRTLGGLDVRTMIEKDRRR
ncbi:MAG: type II toxin-antitoxin system prevent-host-death family antitoxin [Actinobacteria bacterium]|nr:type II toxin-antitoxin system prevent-host-death family antitoxin [Actinomycetota bacterium]